MSGTAWFAGHHLDVSSLRIAVVWAAFNKPVTAGLRDGALEALRDAGAADVTVIEVPGAFELPLVARRLAEKGYDAVVALGAVIEGETDHYTHVAHRASEGLMRVMLETGVPVGFGVLTTRDAESALMRSQPGAGNKGAEAAIAAAGTALLLRELAE